MSPKAIANTCVDKEFISCSQHTLVHTVGIMHNGGQCTGGSLLSCNQPASNVWLKSHGDFFNFPEIAASNSSHACMASSLRRDRRTAGSRQDVKPLKIADGWRNYSTQRLDVQRSQWTHCKCLPALWLLEILSTHRKSCPPGLPKSVLWDGGRRAHSRQENVTQREDSCQSPKMMSLSWNTNHLS